MGNIPIWAGILIANVRAEYGNDMLGYIVKNNRVIFKVRDFGNVSLIQRKR